MHAEVAVEDGARSSAGRSAGARGVVAPGLVADELRISSRVLDAAPGTNSSHVVLQPAMIERADSMPVTTASRSSPAVSSPSSK